MDIDANTVSLASGFVAILNSIFLTSQNKIIILESLFSNNFICWIMLIIVARKKTSSLKIHMMMIYLHQVWGLHIKRNFCLYYI